MAQVLQIAAPTDELMQQYLRAAEHHGYSELQGSPDGYIMISDEQDRFVLGCTVYETHGAYILFEDAVSAPGVSLNVVRRAADLMVAQAIGLCNVRGKHAICCVTSPGLKSLLERRGFRHTPGFILRRDPVSQPVDVVEPKPRRLPAAERVRRTAKVRVQEEP